MFNLSLKIGLLGIVIVAYFTVLANRIYAQGPMIHWMSWEQMENAQKKEKRKVIVDLYTDWCGWCKRMDATTFKNAEVVELLNNNFYAVKFDAEYKSDIVYYGKLYRFVPQGNRGYHELAAKITNGQLSYPTFVYLDESLTPIQAIPGYREAEVFSMIAKYFSGNFYKTTPFQVFQEDYLKNQK